MVQGHENDWGCNQISMDMNEMLKVTLASNGKRVTISIDTIEAIEELDEGCQIWVRWKESAIVVKESFEIIDNYLRLGI